MKKILLIIIILIVCGCTDNNYKEDNLDKIIKEGNYIIVDVRSIHEYKDNHIENAINIPHDRIDENIDLDKDKVILVYCRSGNRSKLAYDELKKLGYDVYDLGAMDNVDLPKN